jgi:hypothetical protein
MKGKFVNEVLGTACAKMRPVSALVTMLTSRLPGK